MNKALRVYASYYMRREKVIKELLQTFIQQGEKIAIWGAGLKGEAFLQIFDYDKNQIEFVYDIDNKKYGKKTKRGHVIVNYKEKVNQEISIVFLMNSVYENEVAFLLKAEGIETLLINLDSMIEGELTTKEIIAFYMEGILR